MVELDTGNARYLIRFTQTLEQQAGWAWAMFSAGAETHILGQLRSRAARPVLARWIKFRLADSRRQPTQAAHSPPASRGQRSSQRIR